MANTIPAAEHRTRPNSASDKPAGAFGPQRDPLSVAQYHEMIDSGSLDDIRCELIHGWIFEIMPPKPPHSQHVRALVKFLMPMVNGDEYVVGVQDAIALADSEPQPDLFVAVGPEDKYSERHPGPGDLVLVVEVSDTPVRQDRIKKLKLYASAGIPQYWIIDVKQRRIEVYTEPRSGKKPGFGTHTSYGPMDDIPIVIGGSKLGAVRASKLLP